MEEKETQENKEICIRNWEELLKDIKAETGNALQQEAFNNYIYVVLIDKVILNRWGQHWQQKAEEEELDFQNMLECRIFNEECEYRLARTARGADWKKRVKIEKKIKEKSDGQDYFDEQQYFDIDDTSSSAKHTNNMANLYDETKVYATGGGCYCIPVSLPETKNVMLKIRNYVNYYEETGQAYIEDWRLVSIGKAEKKETEKIEAEKQERKQERK